MVIAIMQHEYGMDNQLIDFNKKYSGKLIESMMNN
jgi:hypothetical protein